MELRASPSGTDTRKGVEDATDGVLEKANEANLHLDTRLSTTPSALHVTTMHQL